MNGSNTVQRGGSLGVASERNGQHRVDRLAKAERGRLRAPAERAVLGHGRSDQRMRELQQNRAQPRDDENAFGVNTS